MQFHIEFNCSTNNVNIENNQRIQTEKLIFIINLILFLEEYMTSFIYLVLNMINKWNVQGSQENGEQHYPQSLILLVSLLKNKLFRRKEVIFG